MNLVTMGGALWLDVEIRYRSSDLHILHVCMNDQRFD
jgi:hypothetical protein